MKIEPAARSQQPRRLGHPALRIDPDRGAVLREDEVEALATGSPVSPASASTSGNSIPVAAMQRRAVSS